MVDDELLETAIKVFHDECEIVRTGLQNIADEAPHLNTEMSPISARFEAFCRRMEGPLANNSIYPEEETKGLENLLERISEALKNLSSPDKQNENLDKTIDDISRVLKRVTKTLINEHNKALGIEIDATHHGSAIKRLEKSQKHSRIFGRGNGDDKISR